MENAEYDALKVSHLFIVKCAPDDWSRIPVKTFLTADEAVAYSNSLTRESNARIYYQSKASFPDNTAPYIHCLPISAETVNRFISGESMFDILDRARAKFVEAKENNLGYFGSDML